MTLTQPRYRSKKEQKRMVEIRGNEYIYIEMIKMCCDVVVMG